MTSPPSFSVDFSLLWLCELVFLNHCLTHCGHIKLFSSGESSSHSPSARLVIQTRPNSAILDVFRLRYAGEDWHTYVEMSRCSSDVHCPYAKSARESNETTWRSLKIDEIAYRPLAHCSSSHGVIKRRYAPRASSHIQFLVCRCRTPTNISCKLCYPFVVGCFTRIEVIVITNATHNFYLIITISTSECRFKRNVSEKCV